MTIDTESEWNRIDELIDEGNFEGAEEALIDLSDEGGGRRDALLGLVTFQQERYDDAAQAYRRALEHDPDQVEWAHALRLSEANALGEVDQEVPAVHHHEREALLAPPETPRLPPPPDPLEIGPIRRFRLIVGGLAGNLFGGLFGWLTQRFGKNYRGEVWTNWYNKTLTRGILTLAYMREKLFSENLMDPYADGVNVAFQPDGLTPPLGVEHHRTADGSWNNLDDPKEGAAGTRFPRNVGNDAVRIPTDDDLLVPNPRTLSRRLLTREGDMKEVPFLNLLAASWIQFMNHDWISHGDNIRTEIISIPLDEDDPARRMFRQKNMFVGRTQPDPTRQDKGEPTDLTFINEVTQWWDGSQIYGSDQKTQDRLRSRTGGKMKVTEAGTLPLDDKGVEDTGMTRNWWVGLSMLHNLFVLEHNAICDHLAECYPDWDDDRLFNVARLINAAVMAKIHSIEWTPAILPNHGLDMGLNMNWYGGLTYRLRSPEKRKTVATYNVTNPELGGLVGNKIEKHGSAFGLSQEFVEIYRLHSLLPETLSFRSPDDEPEVVHEFTATRQAGSPKIVSQIGMSNLFFSFGTQHPGQLTLGNFPRFMQEMSIPGNPVFDLGAVDILRARERSVPRYNEFRRQLGLNPIRTWADLTKDAKVIETLEELYEDVEQLDLMIGTLAEGTRPDGFGFGETMFQIFILNASRRLQADRFFTDAYNEEVYTAEGMAWVDTTTFKDVILRHYPELAETGLGNIRNAFEPWDDERTLDAVRHPLRAFKKELKDNPWLGDKYR